MAGAVGHVIEFAGSTSGPCRSKAVSPCATWPSKQAHAPAWWRPTTRPSPICRAGPMRPRQPNGKAADYWKSLPSDEGAHFDAEIAIDAAGISPWSPGAPRRRRPCGHRRRAATGGVDAARRDVVARSLDYMGLVPGMPLAGCRSIRCSSAPVPTRASRTCGPPPRCSPRSAIPAIVSPGSTLVKRAAEAEGLDRIFKQAGFEWREPGCSMCCGMNGDLVAAGKRCASTSNRNFPGRQGRGARTHLMSPAMAAAAALAGRIVDARDLAGAG